MRATTRAVVIGATLVAATTAAARVCPAAGGDVGPAFTPELLSRLSRSVVKVRRGDDWQTGFVFGTTRHVVTSYSVANASGDLQIVDANQRVHEANVLSWSESDDLALLELRDDVEAPPLSA